MIIIQLKRYIFCLDEKQFQVSLETPAPETEDGVSYASVSWDELVSRIESYPDITVQVIYYNGRFLHNTARWFGSPNDFTVNHNDSRGIDFINRALSAICGGNLTPIIREGE